MTFIHRPSIKDRASSRHQIALCCLIVPDTWPRSAFALTLTSHVYRDSGPPSENAICIIYPIHHQHRAARNFGLFCTLLQKQMERRRPAMSTHGGSSPPSQMNWNILTWLQPAGLQLVHPSFASPGFFSICQKDEASSAVLRSSASLPFIT